MANSRGDALLIDHLDLAAFRVVATDVQGASSATTVSNFRVGQRLPADIGEDGTAAVAGESEDKAPAIGPFGAPVGVSPLGTANIGRHIFTAIQASGERLLAWQADRFDPPGKVVAARGTRGPDPPAPPDTKAPRLTARVSALRKGRFEMKLGCGERCAVAVSVLPPVGSPEVTFIGDLPLAAVNRPRTVSWRLTASQRRNLRVLLALGSVRVFVNAVDAAGNKRTRLIAAVSPE